ncbi:MULTISPECIES: peptidylprolyl isomerase [unclassified Janthinobacterium]|uniref:peptidylprolyl isomerase n=1 Tax=unclassified Janthinobacterium TaxID=2610881 RepID=UPI00088487C5|nr:MULTISPECIES: peptidylprolyl isomerase [unclassified Janthinobacterium]SDA47425.1 peptidylprolyl isomerase [Janthinobacterium sp. 551a]SFB01360.1 peptidylprolyl isomerase [Janthinobacterium sp. 344]
MYLHPLSGLAMATALGLAQLSAHAAPVQIKAPAELPAKPGIADAVKASKPSDWRPLDPDNTLYLELSSGRVVMELAPEFAPQHVANIKALVAEQYYDGLAINRAQDNWVVQWGDPNEKNPKPILHARRTLPGEFTVPLKNISNFTRLPDADGYAPQVGHSNGFASARDPKSGTAWLTHCYATVGVGRDNASDSGGGTELYAVIGQSPRHLDRDITVIGRVVAGMPLLSTLPRGTAPMGFYDSPEKNVPIKAIRLAADVPPAQRSHLEVMRTDSAAYQAVLEAQRNRGGPWSKVTAGHVDLCNAPIPVREVGK